MENTYSKYCPNVFVAKCPERHEKGETIIVTTKYGKENEHIVWNLVYERDGFFYYSITRADGFDCQERARAKAERYNEWSDNADKRSKEAFDRAMGAVEGIPFGQPILVGHHSEKRHRAAIAKSDNAMRKSVEESDKASRLASKAEYWERKAEDINLSMPESVEYYTEKLSEAEEYHAGVKSGKYPREHAYTLTYAKKAVNEMRKNLETAKKLWGEQ